jgi:hypothetical protein
MVKDNGRYALEIDSSIAMAKGSIKQAEVDLHLRKKLVKFSFEFGAETGTLRIVCEKYLGSFEMWCWRRMEKISWTDRVRNEVLHRQGGVQYPTYNKTSER